MELKIDELEITNVSHYKSKYLDPGFIIEFSIDGFRYNLHTEKQENGVVYPHHIIHMDTDNDCKYCENELNYCLELMNYNQELFHRLIEFPSIRLEWLFIDHA